MIEELGKSIEAFPGAANQNRCFLHIVNLVAKGVLRQFEPPKKQGEDGLAEGAAELLALVGELVDDESGELENDIEEDVDDNVEDDDVDGLEETRAEMTPEEIEELEEDVKPVCMVLAKVSNFGLSFCS